MVAEFGRGPTIQRYNQSMKNSSHVENPILHTREYVSLLSEIKEKIQASQEKALKVVNFELVNLYREIGKTILSEQEKQSWGMQVVEQLSLDLRNAFPGMKGFSPRSLWKMRDFFLSYKEQPSVQPLTSQISWSHNLILLEKCKDNLEREFYIKMTLKYKWSKRSLASFISSKTYEKTLLSQSNFKEQLPKDIHHKASTVVKDEYAFDFLELEKEHSERELEKAILSKIERFLREMGGLFTFVGSQYHLEVDGDDFFIDLVLYHRKLKCLVAIDLKVGKFLPEHVGKMQFYLAALDAKARVEGENESIGIILCKERQRTIVEYTLQQSKKPMVVSGYSLSGSSADLPEDLQNVLPSAEQIRLLIDSI